MLNLKLEFMYFFQFEKDNRKKKVTINLLKINYYVFFLLIIMFFTKQNKQVIINNISIFYFF